MGTIVGQAFNYNLSSEIEKLVVITLIVAPQEQCHTLDGGWHHWLYLDAITISSSWRGP